MVLLLLLRYMQSIHQSICPSVGQTVEELYPAVAAAVVVVVVVVAATLTRTNGETQAMPQPGTLPADHPSIQPASQPGSQPASQPVRIRRFFHRTTSQCLTHAPLATAHAPGCPSRPATRPRHRCPPATRNRPRFGGTAATARRGGVGSAADARPRSPVRRTFLRKERQAPLPSILGLGIDPRGDDRRPNNPAGFYARVCGQAEWLRRWPASRCASPVLL